MGHIIILVNKDIKILEKQINEYIERGYNICGSICYNPDEKIYLQSMIS